MSIYRALVGFLLLACGLSFAAAQQQNGVLPNNLFTAAGFVVKYATTPEKSAILKILATGQTGKRERRTGKLYYVYADAARCNCAYVGTPQAYAAYQNWGNDPNYGGGSQQSNAMQILEGDDDADDRS